jgi:hypothetical protein
MIAKCLLQCVLFCVVTLCSYNRIEAANLHAILVADTVGGEFEFATSIDSMQREIKKIASLTGLSLNGLIFEGMNVRIENVLSEISHLPVEPDDVVIIYFTMHGNRPYEKTNRWPNLIFTLDQVLGNETLDFQVVKELVLSKKPRFVLALAECCNSYDFEDPRLDDDSDDTDLGSSISLELPSPSHQKFYLNDFEKDLYVNVCEDDSALYNELFNSYKGSVIISTSSPGEPSIKFPVIGGVFTIKFLESLEEFSFKKNYLQKGSAKNDWEWLLQFASQITQEELALKGFSETPQFEVHLNN